VNRHEPRPGSRSAAAGEVFHIVLTRFNVRTYVTGATDVVSPEWIRRRLDLFETFCLPSMQAQSAQCDWLVFFDAGTPPDLRRRVESHTGYAPVWVDGALDNLRVSEFVTDRLPSRARTLITTRLDNDDAVASDFVARIQHAARGQDRLYINFPFGYQWDNGRIYYYLHFANPFLSLVERLPPGAIGRRSPTTVISGNHDRLGRTGRLRQVWRPPMWVQVIHADNVLNELVGVRRPSLQPPDRFPAIPLAADRSADRQLDVARSAGRLAALAWRRRERIARRIATRARGG